MWKFMYLNCGEWYEDMTDHRSYALKVAVVIWKPETKIPSCTGFEPMTSARPVRWSITCLHTILRSSNIFTSDQLPVGLMAPAVGRAPVAQWSWLRIPSRPEFQALISGTTASVVCITAMINHVRKNVFFWTISGTEFDQCWNWFRKNKFLIHGGLFSSWI